MRTRRIRGTLVPALAIVLVAGCGNGPGADAVAWTDEVCGALAGFTRAVTDQPAIDRTDPVGTVGSLREYFDSTSSALRTSITTLDGIGSAPVDGGDQYLAALRDNMGQIRSSFREATTQLAEVDTSSTASMAAALPAAMAPLQELGSLADPTQDVRADGELRAALDEAPNCQRLRAEGSTSR